LRGRTIALGRHDKEDDDMVWITLTSAVLALSLVVAVVALALVNRRRATRMPGAFPCRVRARPGACWERFRRMRATARWVGGVLAVQGGVGLTATRLYPVVAADAVRPLRPGDVRGLGTTPRSVILILDDGSLLEVAVAADHAGLLAGPVVPRAPSRRS
jgi:hypothetical protein